MTTILIIKTAALGDVLRTTSVLAGLAARYQGARITWVTAAEAVDLVVHHPLVDRVVTVDVRDPVAMERVGEELARERWDLVLSFDDEIEECRLATRAGGRARSGAFVDPTGVRCYTDDVEPWFGMGLLARDGRDAADERKRTNQRSHAAIFAAMLDIAPGRPELPISMAFLEGAARELDLTSRRARGPLVGFNTGAGGRWRTKAIPVGRCVALIAELHARRDGAIGFVLFGGSEEAERNRQILAGVRALDPRPDLVDAGNANPILGFGALVSCCDLLVTSDSLGMHVAIARGVPVVAFFAPTSAAEIDVFGLGEKVVSTEPDYCSYRTDASNATITVERLADASERVLARYSVTRP